jgi:hypothetical protein
VAVSLGNGITSIEDCAFWYCPALTSINIPQGVTEIGRCVFMRCSSLTSIILPDGLLRIDPSAFCSTSLTSIKIPRSVTSIEQYALAYCESLASVDVSANTTIHDEAFFGCVALEALAARYDMNVNTYIVQLPILRAAFYHFLLCENARSFLNNEDVMKVIAGFLFIVPTPPPVADDYVLPTAADAARRLQLQLELQRRSAQGSSSSSSSTCSRLAS